MSKLVTAIFNSRSAAEQAVEELIKSGFAREDISLLMSETTRGREFAVKKTSKVEIRFTQGTYTGRTVVRLGKAVKVSAKR